ncbi:MAG TPA: peptidoglycan-associated lipoprotein Pal [Vicinamibacterales bacterium]|nr:peptidoglycan-associated lipoprotein Pal [Vicinamibacterales bacterium]
MRLKSIALVLIVLVLAAGVGCRKKQPPVTRPTPPPPAAEPTTAPQPPAPPAPTQEPTIPPEPTVAEVDLNAKDLDTLNRESPFQPVFFGFDSAEIESDAQSALNTNAELLKRYPGWTITIEGHCDERGTAEYNLALGERRALAARNYLVSLGISADRLRTISYGKEFPFDPGHNEEAWARNRRAHFVVTAK